MSSTIHFCVCYYFSMKFFILQPHQDGPAYFPVVAILSLGSPVVMDFTPHARFKQNFEEDINKDLDGGTFEIGKDKWFDGHHQFSILLVPRSLLIFKDKAYSGYSQLL